MDGRQSDLGRQLMLTNVLIGDPAIELAIPVKPNLNVSGNDITSIPAFPSDDNDFLQLKIPYHNFGSVPQDSFQVKIGQSYLTGKSDTTFSRKLPLYADTLTVDDILFIIFRAPMTILYN